MEVFSLASAQKAYKVEIIASGVRRELAVQAANPNEAAAKVRAQVGDRGMVVKIVPSDKKKPFLSLFGRVNPRDLEMLCRNLLVMHQAGVTTLEALETAASQATKKPLKNALELAASNIREGLPLKDAFRGSPNVFPEVFCQVIDAAEEAGALEKGLEALVSHFEREARFKEKLRQALAYPIIVAVLAVLVAVGLFTFVVPKFAKTLVDAGIPLPFTTKIVLGFSQHIGIIIPSILIAAAAICWAYKKTAQVSIVRRCIEAMLARVPLIGVLVVRSAAARFCRMLALLLDVGVPVVEALEVSERACPLVSLQDEIKVARTVVRSGGQLSGTFKRSKWLPPIVSKMAVVGERSGRLAEMLERAADAAEIELEAAVQKLPTVAEGGMLVCVGGLVLFVLLSIFLPIISMYQAVK